MDRFDDFIDLEEEDYDEEKMRFFAQSLSGEAKRWFKDIIARSIANFEAFQTLFPDSWEDKKSSLRVLAQYNNLRKGNLEFVYECSSKFMRVYN